MLRSIRYTLFVLLIVYPFAPFGYIVLFNQGATLLGLAWFAAYLSRRHIILVRDVIVLSFVLLVFALPGSYFEVFRLIVTVSALAILSKQDLSKVMRCFLLFNSAAVILGIVLLYGLDMSWKCWDVDHILISQTNPLWQRNFVTKDFDYFFVFRFWVQRFSQGVVDSRFSFYFIEPFYYWLIVLPFVVYTWGKHRIVNIFNILGLLIAFSLWGFFALLISLGIIKIMTKKLTARLIYLILGIGLVYLLINFTRDYFPSKWNQIQLQLEFIMQNPRILYEKFDLSLLDKGKYQYGFLALNDRFYYGTIFYIMIMFYIFFMMVKSNFSVRGQIALLVSAFMGLKSPDLLPVPLIFIYLIEFKNSHTIININRLRI